MSVIRLPPDWYKYIVIPDVNEDCPGIYEWDINGAGIYVGKYKNISRPVKEYSRNVQNFLNGKAYRLSNPDGFRRIHRELARAYNEKRQITLTILENVDPLHINKRERELIAERGSLNN